MGLKNGVKHKLFTCKPRVSSQISRTINQEQKIESRFDFDFQRWIKMSLSEDKQIMFPIAEDFE